MKRHIVALALMSALVGCAQAPPTAATDIVATRLATRAAMQPVFRDWGYCVIDTAARMARQTRESAEAVAIAALMECGQFEGKYSDLVKTYLADPYDQVQASRAILYDTAVASAIATREQK